MAAQINLITTISQSSSNIVSRILTVS